MRPEACRFDAADCGSSLPETPSRPEIAPRLMRPDARLQNVEGVEGWGRVTYVTYASGVCNVCM